MGIVFRNKDLLVQALTHRSSAHESGVRTHNERLEFLGDAVLELVATEFLYSVSDQSEGELTNFRSALVKGEHLAEVAAELKVGECLCLSRGEEASGGREKPSTLANALEAIIGAMYLDQGFDRTREFVFTFILSKLRTLVARGMHRDPKSLFQEIAQARLNVTPAYEVLSEEGPDHEKVFTVSVLLGQERVAEGKGLSKQRAEQAAAESALKSMKWK